MRPAMVCEPARETPVISEVDVLVTGGGPSGLIAALAAAESGLRVALIEGRSFVGGNMTIGLPVLGFSARKKSRSSPDSPRSLSIASASATPLANTAPAPFTWASRWWSRKW